MGLLLEWTKGNSIEKRSSKDDLGGSMCLGAYECHDGTLLETSIKKILFLKGTGIDEANVEFKSELERAGLKFSECPLMVYYRNSRAW